MLLLVLVNIYFYATSTRQIGKQLVYNRNMQHFQVLFFPCFFYLYFRIYFLLLFFLHVFQNIFLQGQLRPFHKALPCCRCLLAVPGRFFFFGGKKIFLYTFNLDLFLRLLPCWTYQLWSTLGRSSLCCRYYCEIYYCHIVTTNLLILDLMTLFQGPLIFVVAMCRTRVAFLFKRYFCQVPMLQTSS